jgi:hypothetical protein
LTRGEGHVAVGGRAGGDVVGRGAADRGAPAAGGSGRAGRVAVRSGADGAVRQALGTRSSRVGRVGRRSRASDARDRDLCAADGAQAAPWLGVPDAGGGGFGLDSLAAVLSDRAKRAGSRRVDGSKAHSADRTRDGQRRDARADLRGGPREALPGACGASRLDGDRGRRQVPDRCGPGRAGRQGARAGGPQARREDRRDEDAGARPLTGDGPPAARDRSHGPPALGGGEGAGHGA